SGPAGTVILNGTYTFCDVKLSQEARMLFQGPSTVYVEKDVHAGNNVVTGPDPDAVVPPPSSEIRWFVNGKSVKFSRRDQVKGVMCALKAKLSAINGSHLSGQFVAKDIQLRGVTVVQGSTPTSTTTTTQAPATTT